MVKLLLQCAGHIKSIDPAARILSSSRCRCGGALQRISRIRHTGHSTRRARKHSATSTTPTCVRLRTLSCCHRGTTWAPRGSCKDRETQKVHNPFGKCTLTPVSADPCFRLFPFDPCFRFEATVSDPLCFPEAAPHLADAGEAPRFSVWLTERIAVDGSLILYC